VLPPAIAAEVLAEAREQERQEAFVAERVAAGESIDGLFPLPEARRPEYEAWLARQLQREPAPWNIEPVITGSMEHRAGEPDPSPGTGGA
jgi:hypothetical protein